ncbi:hypothetical protein E2P81_ATG08333 [Venturia nashicola]|nr:hypothetical protein E2P81_ATG08333 [Venturia nashicola]
MEPQKPRKQVLCDVEDDVEVLDQSFVLDAEPERTAEEKLLLHKSSLNSSSPTVASANLHQKAMMDASYYDSDSSAFESGSERESKAPLQGIKPLSEVKSPNHPPPGPPLTQSTTAQRPRASSFAPAPLIGQKLDDVKLSPPASLAAVDGDEDEWDFADTRDEDPAEEGSEEWETIDSSMLDLATGTMKVMPSAVFQNENFRQTVTKFMEIYTEKCTPSSDTQHKFYKVMETLRFVGEFGYECVKEPLVDWADIVAVKMLDMPLDEASSQLRNDLLSYLPESTKAAYQRLRGDLTAINNLAQELRRINVNPMEKDEVELQTIPSNAKEKKATTRLIFGMKRAMEKPTELKSTPIDAEAEERRNSFKQEMTELLRTRALEDQKRAAERKSSYQADDQTTSFLESLPSEPSPTSRSLVSKLKPVPKTTAVGQISPSRINHTAQKMPPKIASRPKGTFPSDLDSLESRPMASKPNPVSFGTVNRVITTDLQKTSPTNRTAASELVRSSTKITQTTQRTEAARTAAIDVPTTKASLPVVAAPTAAPSEFSSPPLEQVTSRRSMTLSLNFTPYDSSSPYGADADEDSDEEL